MSSLLNSLSSGVDIEKVSNVLNNEFIMKMNNYGSTVILEYNKLGCSLNDGIAKIAEANKLTDDQIQRVVEYVNNHVYLEKYAKLKSFPEREVVFDLSSLPGVKNVMNKKEEKVASESSVLNFLNYSSHDMVGFSPDKKKELKQIFAEKLASELSTLNSDIEKSVQSYADNAYTIVEALIRYDRMNKNAQEIFEDMVTGANISKGDQIIFKESMNQKINQMKEYKEIPDDYQLEIKLASQKEKSKFSLGNKSYIPSTKSPGTIVTGDQKVIKGIQSLIDAAQRMQSDKAKIKTLSTRKEDLKKAVLKNGK